MTLVQKSLAELGPPMVAARSAEVYAWAPDLVLKLFYRDFPRDTAQLEYLNATEAHAQGATSVRCLGDVEIDGRMGIVLGRLNGKTLTAAFDANPLMVFSAPKTLARLHAQVHAGSSGQMQDIKSVISQQLDQPALGFLSAPQKSKLRAYLRALPDGNTLLHLDFHPDNVLIGDDAETVIDWATAARGAVGADLAMTYFLFHEAELFPGISKLQEMLYNTIRKFVYRGYIKHYVSLRGTTHEAVMVQVRDWYLPILVCRLALWSAPTEVARLQAQITAGIDRLTTI